MDLKTRYLGLDLAHPFVPGASPLADTIDSVRRLEDCGAPLITLRSLFEEQIVSEQLATFHAAESTAHVMAEASTVLADPDGAVFGPHEYLSHLQSVREAVGVPVVASLNGNSSGGWLGYAQLIAEAGADAIELNVYDLATNPHLTGSSIEDEFIAMLRAVRESLSIPIAVKLSPFYTSLPHFARQLQQAGADALIIFNRFYQPDIDVEELETATMLRLSTSDDLLLRLRWLAILQPHLSIDLAVTGGVHTVEDSVKALMCGATVAQVVSCLLERGPEHLTVLRDGLSRWLDDHEYASLDELRGSMSLANCPDPRAFERNNYMQVLQSWRD